MVDPSPQTSEPRPTSGWIRVPVWGERIRRDEAGAALVLTLLLFLLFSAYYIIKPIREGLILSLSGGAELKSSAGAVQAVVFILLVPFYRFVAGRFSGRRILIGIYLAMAGNLLIFLLLGRMQFHYLGVVFYFWVGVFNMLTISQTYSLCAEIFTPEQGKRLFPLIAFGAASGAVFGSLVLKTAAHRMGLFWPMAAAAALLVLCAVIIGRGIPKGRGASQAPAKAAEPAGSARVPGGFKLLFHNRYLALIAGMILVSNLINTNSEYMLGRLVSDHFRAVAAAAGHPDGWVRASIGGFYADFSLWVNGAVLLFQALAVSRLVRFFGVSRVLWAVPALALVSYGLAVLFPVLAVLRVVKIAENATDYSLNNTAREMLFLPLSTAEKYQGKLAADTIFRRLGDALSRPCVFMVMELFALGIGGFAALNLALVAAWGGMVFAVGRKRRQMNLGDAE